MKLLCIGCHSTHVSCLGSLPLFSADFLGTPLAQSVNHGSLYKCLNCGLSFRYPTPTEDELTSHYGGLSSDSLWQHDSSREVWREIEKVLDPSPERSILDVGCFRGDFLNYLGDKWDRFGIEPSSGARQVARARGIEIIADNVESLQDTGQRFGAITLVDVMEHLLSPVDALRKLLGLLKSDGHLIVFTGNTSAWSWRFAGLHYWYSALPEHVAFYNPQWFEWAARELNCRVTLVRRLRYQPAPLRTRIDETLKNASYITYHRLKSWPALRKVVFALPMINRIKHWESCWWTSARDHMLVVLTKDV